jgi:hypothetical protein
VKIIALVPVRNEAWVLEHSLTCWSGFCDVIIVSDQGSVDGTRDVCRQFPKVVLLESSGESRTDRLPQRARWRLFDAARQYGGNNLLWCTDADELTPPVLAREHLGARAGALTPGRVIECQFFNAWGGFRKYRQDLSVYGPRWKAMGFVDDRRADYPREPDRRPLHEPRIPIMEYTDPLRIVELPILHLQFAIWNRNQMKQAWYRCVDWLDRRFSAAYINDFYAITLPEWYVKTEEIPAAWRAQITVPADDADEAPSWHESEILAWFDEHGADFFEPLEIWHIPKLRSEFRRRVGRSPRPDRSYQAPPLTRATRLGRRVFNAARRRIVPGR